MHYGTPLLAVLGLLLALLPIRWLLRFDRKIGFAIYHYSPNEAVGLRRAAWFYRVVGAVVTAYAIWLMFH